MEVSVSYSSNLQVFSIVVSSSIWFSFLSISQRQWYFVTLVNQALLTEWQSDQCNIRCTLLENDSTGMVILPSTCKRSVQDNWVRCSARTGVWILTNWKSHIESYIADNRTADLSLRLIQLLIAVECEYVCNNWTEEETPHPVRNQVSPHNGPYKPQTMSISSSIFLDRKLYGSFVPTKGIYRCNQVTLSVFHCISLSALTEFRLFWSQQNLGLRCPIALP